MNLCDNSVRYSVLWRDYLCGAQEELLFSFTVASGDPNKQSEQLAGEYGGSSAARLVHNKAASSWAEQSSE